MNMLEIKLMNDHECRCCSHGDGSNKLIGFHGKGMKESLLYNLWSWVSGFLRYLLTLREHLEPKRAK